MQIFISFSGHQSKYIASFLRTWIGDVFQTDEIFLSDRDIDAGTNWISKLTSALKDSTVGILCVTPENINAPWLLFEAGALSQKLHGKVVPYLTGIKSTDISLPLAHFQSVESNKEGTYKLIKSINSLRDNNLSEERITKLFDKWWPELEEILSQIPEISLAEKDKRSDRDILEEILTHVRRSTPNSALLNQKQSNSDETEFLRRPLLEYNETDISSMNTSRLKSFIEQIEKRYSIAPSINEEMKLDTLHKIANKILKSRKTM